VQTADARTKRDSGRLRCAAYFSQMVGDRKQKIEHVARLNEIEQHWLSIERRCDLEN
jgi:hypothetical protein